MKKVFFILMTILMVMNVQAQKYPYTYKFTNQFHYFSMEEAQAIDETLLGDLSMAGNTIVGLQLFIYGVGNSNVNTIYNSLKNKEEGDNVKCILRMSDGSTVSGLSTILAEKKSYLGAPEITKLEFMIWPNDFGKSMNESTKEVQTRNLRKFRSYDIESITANGRTIELGNFKTSETIDAMLTDMAKKTFYLGYDTKRTTSSSSSTTTSSTTSNSKWTSLVGKKLTLGKYGLIGNGGTEANSFRNNTNEYMQLQSNGLMVWNNRQDGSSSFYYTIEGNKVYFGNSKGDRQYYFEIISSYGNTIKTHDKIGTYRYFSW